MEFRTLRTFVRVASLQSFSKAAMELGYTQAAITIQIQQLEKELHVRLFERFGKTISLTQQGEILLQYAHHLLQISDEARQALQQHQLCGHIHIGTIESLCASGFPSILQQYHTLYPHVKISIDLSSPESLLIKMNQNNLDIVYLLDKPRFHHDWIKVLEKPEEIIFVCSQQHPLRSKKHTTIDEILAYEIILTEKAASYRCEFEQYLAIQNKTIEPYLEIGNTEIIIQMLIQSQGISFLPQYCVQKYINAHQLSILKPTDFAFFVSRQIFYHKDKWITPEMKAFLQLVKTMHENISVQTS